MSRAPSEQVATGPDDAIRALILEVAERYARHHSDWPLETAMLEAVILVHSGLLRSILRILGADPTTFVIDVLSELDAHTAADA